MANKKKQTSPADFYVGISGNHGQRDADEPKLGEQVEYTVYGTVTGIHETIRDDGETRLTYTVTAEAVWPKGSKRPDHANQGTLVDHDGNVTAEATGDGDATGEAGGELIDTTDNTSD
ncbi:MULTISPECIES: hypothetical protein [unclassified Mycobacterium]|uniref:hypothetical protein n=1 Tax=unclassified Mycobacterium TaxID=2642494 RepID=UPI0029C96737|nr:MULTISPECIES: hypothetical protein [unclassified Mycobacterium]